MILTILIFLAVLSLLVFVHEFGHFITAKKSGIRVDEFGFGFPPRMFGVKRGGTVYSVNWIPLGGFVKIKGETGEDNKDKDSFASKSGWVRLMVLTAGVIMNVLLAWVLFTVGFLIGMPQIIDSPMPHARVTDAKTQVLSVLEGSPAAEADIQRGDAFVTIDGVAVDGAASVQALTREHEGQTLHVTLYRGTELLHKEVVPVMLAGAERPAIGVELAKTGMVSYPLWFAPVQGAAVTWTATSQIVIEFGRLIGNLFMFRPIGVDLSGPVGIAVITSEVAAMGFRYLLQFTALLSLNLAVINILPFPALDGGRVLFLAIEKARGRAVSRMVEVAAHNLGFLLLMLLVVFVTYGDFVRYGSRFMGGLSRFFGGG